jgi:hypothetical protein
MRSVNLKVSRRAVPKVIAVKVEKRVDLRQRSPNLNEHDKYANPNIVV